MRTLAQPVPQRPANGAFQARSHAKGQHTLAMLGLQRDTTLIAAFVRALRRRLAR
ncbi:hypothetical protein [Breoghania sp. JC706]|uniref:hypothetical protein n=1 Tax=Breoghania sp. JC706 TaxID=3117732 RepID=UPI003009DDCA